MNIVLSFVGKLPNYIVDSIHQIRSFSESPIYVILDDQQSQYLPQLLKYNVNIIKYDDVIDIRFIDTANQNQTKFPIVPGLGDRSHLFMRAFERFFLVHNLMEKHNLTNCFFMEVDNLIYDDPNAWLELFSKNELCYLFDNTDRCSAGIMYIKQSSSIQGLLDYFIDYISTSIQQVDEMTCLYRYYANHTNDVQLLPIYWKHNNINELAYTNNIYNNSIFDAAAMGVFLLGRDPYHTKGKIETGHRNPYSAIDYTNQKFEWKKDEKNRNKPYIWDGEKWLLINNLHIHSKALKNGLSLAVDSE